MTEQDKDEVNALIRAYRRNLIRARAVTPSTGTSRNEINFYEEGIIHCQDLLEREGESAQRREELRRHAYTMLRTIAEYILEESGSTFKHAEQMRNCAKAFAHFRAQLADYEVPDRKSN